MLGFAGFLRYSEFANLKESDVTFYDDHVELFIETSKTDQYRDGSVVVIAQTGSECCPVAMLRRYLRMAGVSIDRPSDKYLFRKLVNTKNGQQLRGSTNLSYTRARDLVLDML